MSAMIGADIDGLRALATSFDQSAGRLRTLSAGVRQGIQLSVWVGPFAHRFRHTWDTEHSRTLRSAAEALEVAARTLRSEASAQERASSSASLSVGEGHAPSSTRALLDLAPGDDNGDGVRIIKVLGDEGQVRYIVDIQGTRFFDHPDKLFDSFENVPLVNGVSSQTMQYVEQKMRDMGITSRDQVVLVGYSQGGLIAQNIANSGRWGDPLVVTKASPQVLGGVGSHDILRFEVEHDFVVDRLNPFAPIQDLVRPFTGGSGDNVLVRGDGGVPIPAPLSALGILPANAVAGTAVGVGIHLDTLALYGNLADDFDHATDTKSAAMHDRLAPFLGGQVLDDSR